MPILVNEKGERFESSDAQQIYNALKGGQFQLENGSKLVVRDVNNQAFELNPDAGNINQQLTQAFESGARFEQQDEAFRRLYPYLDNVGGDLLAAGYAAADTAFFGGVSALASQNQQAKEFVTGLQADNPLSTAVGTVAGLVIPGAPAAAAANLALKAGNVIQGTSTAAKVGQLALGGAAMGAVSSVPMAVTEQALGDSELSAERFLSHVGTGAFLGSVINPAAVGLGNYFAGTKMGETITNAITQGIGKASKRVSNLSEEQTQVFDKMLSDPGFRSKMMKISNETEQEAIINTGETLTKVNKLVNEDLKRLYNEEFTKLAENAPKADVIGAKNEILTMIKNAEDQIAKFPESYDASYLKALTAARKTLNVEGVKNAQYREALTKLVQEDKSMLAPAQKAFESAQAKAIKEVRTEIGYVLDKLGTKVGNNQTGALADKLYNDITNVANRVYGPDFVRISDTYRDAKQALDQMKKLAFNAEGKVDITKVKTLIGPNAARELKLDEMITKIEALGDRLGNVPGVRAQLSADVADLKAKRVFNTFQREPNEFGNLERSVLAGVGLSSPLAALSYGTYRVLQNPRTALKMIDALQNSQVTVANAVNKAAKSLVENKGTVLKSVVALNAPVDPIKIQKDKDLYQAVINNANMVTQGYQDTFGRLGEVAPNMSAQIQRKAIEAATFLAEKAPNMSAPDVLTGKIQVQDSIQKVKEYYIYQQAVNNPVKAIEDLSKGVNVTQNREVLRTLYPSMWGQFVQDTVQELNGKDLDFNEKRKYNDLLGLNSPEFTIPTVTNDVLKTVTNPQPQQRSIDSRDSRTDRLSRGE